MAENTILNPSQAQAIRQPVEIVETGQSPFSPMLQGKGTNSLVAFSTRTTPPKIDTSTGRATITLGEIMANIDDYSSVKGYRPSTYKLFCACTVALSQLTHFRGSGEPITRISIPLKEYAALLGKSTSKASLDELRKRVKEDLETLYLTSLVWTEKRGKQSEEYDTRILQEKSRIRTGVIDIEFTNRLARYLRSSYIMQFPHSLYKLDERNPNAFTLGYKLALHYGIDNNQRKRTANIISVHTLLSFLEKTIPSYDEVFKSDKAIDKRIIKPLEDALNALVSNGVLARWEYSNSKGAPLTDEQLGIVVKPDGNENRRRIPYQEWAKCFILFEIKDYPNQTARLEARAEEIKARATKKKAHAKKKTDKPKEES